jgi:hypothetical protein
MAFEVRFFVFLKRKSEFRIGDISFRFFNQNNENIPKYWSPVPVIVNLEFE